MTDTVEDLLFFKLKDLITEQSEGEWTDTQIFADAIRFTNALRPMLAASPQGESSSAHPAPIKPSADTGELRERVAQIIEAAIERHNPGNSLRHTIDDADAILDLIQSERAGPRVSILSTKFVGDNTNGQPIFEGGADGVTNITLHGWTCFGPDEAGQKALAGFQSERAE